MVTEAPAARAYLTEQTRRHPKRSKASDGILPSDAHSIQNPTSNHERGNAVDCTTGGPINGDAEFERLRQQAINGDQRITELIHNRKIATRKRGWTVRAYRGDNPHTSHIHISIDDAHRDDTSTWFPTVTANVKPAPKETPVSVLVIVRKPESVWEITPSTETRKRVKATILDLLPEGDRSRLQVLDDEKPLANYKVVS